MKKIYVIFDTRDGEVRGWCEKKEIRDMLLSQRKYIHAEKFPRKELTRYLEKTRPSFSPEQIKYDWSSYEDVITNPIEEDDFYSSLAESSHFDHVYWELGRFHTHLYFRPKGMQINFLIIQKTEKDIIKKVVAFDDEDITDFDPYEYIDETPLLKEFLGIEEVENEEV